MSLIAYSHPVHHWLIALNVMVSGDLVEKPIVEARGRLIASRPVRALVIEKIEVASDARASHLHGVVGVQVDLLILQRTPEPLDEDVVEPAPLAIHADLDSAIQQYVGKVLRRVN